MENQESMGLNEIIIARNSGLFQIKAITINGEAIEEIMGSLGLYPKPSCLREINRSAACEVLKTILWKDLAYHSQLLLESDATERASYLVNHFSTTDTKYFTNGEWENYHRKNGMLYDSLTDATIDAGIIFVNKEYVASIWVQDED